MRMNLYFKMFMASLVFKARSPFAEGDFHFYNMQFS